MMRVLDVLGFAGASSSSSAILNSALVCIAMYATRFKPAHFANMACHCVKSGITVCCKCNRCNNISQHALCILYHDQKSN